jgi:long-chain acyl-CoA synthetase
MGPGDVVAALLPSGVDLMAFTLATRQSGLFLLPLNPRAGAAELKYLVQDSSPRLLVVGSMCVRPELLRLVSPEVCSAVTYVHAGQHIEQRLADFLNGAPDSNPANRVAGDILTYTSGTTGVPKAVLRKLTGLTPEDALKFGLDWYSHSFGVNPESSGSFLGACPLFYSGPLSFASYAFHLGRTLVLMPQWNARLALALVAKHSVSEIFLVPYQLMELVIECRKEMNRYDISSLKTVIHGSAPCSPELKEQALDTFGEIIYESYGSTEVAGTVAAPWEARRYKGTVGRARAPHEVKILDDHGNPRPPGEIGRVFMKMLPGTEFSYKGDQDSTRNCQVGNFATAGDLGFLNESGYLFLKGRSSETINCRGEKVNPSTVESAAMQHPLVLDAAAFGECCALNGESVYLAVRLSLDGRSPEIIVHEVFDLLRESLRTVERPKSIIVVNEIPRGQSGKLRRREIREALRSASIDEFPSTPLA